MRVVLVRPWTDAHGGSGCCGGSVSGGIVLDEHVGDEVGHDAEVHLVGTTYRLLRSELPEVDVQIVGSNNTAYLLPSTFRAVRRRAGALTALREANRSTTAGSVLVDGYRIGDIAALGPVGVLEQVRARYLGLTSSAG